MNIDALPPFPAATDSEDDDSVWLERQQMWLDDDEEMQEMNRNAEENTALLLILVKRSRSRNKTAIKKKGGSPPGKRANVNRDALKYQRLLHKDFWGPDPLLDEKTFKALFRMPLALFNEISEAVTAFDPYFVQKKDATGKWGLSPTQKIAASVRQLSSGVSSAELQDKFRMAPSTGLEALKRFCLAVNALYGAVALRTPNEDDINPSTNKQKMFAINQEAKRKDIERAFGMLQARFHVLTTPCRLWSKDAMKDVIKTCVVLHNLIIDFETKNAIDTDYVNQYIPKHPFVVGTMSAEERAALTEQNRRALREERTAEGMHIILKDDLIAHIWDTFGGGNAN